MAENLEITYRPLLEAIAFAARAHRQQVRKDGETPYVSHVFRVCLIVRDLFGIDDPQTLMTALLHDTIEDTTTDHDDLAENFGGEVADWVAALSKDGRLPEAEREQAYARQLARAPWQVKVCKLADVFDNLMDSTRSRPELRSRLLQRAHRYLDAARTNLPQPARRPWEIVSQLLADLESPETGQLGKA
jgi:guanosine-3',5'-bis(diphosphate) 3'-pyrophosphohydrolase